MLSLSLKRNRKNPSLFSSQFLFLSLKMYNFVTSCFLHLLLLLLSSYNVVILAGARQTREEFRVEENPFTPKASVIRYWNQEIRTGLPKPLFFISKSSPLTAVEAASFTKSAAENRLTDRLTAFCYAANLFCFPDLSVSLDKHEKDSSFSVYSQKNFTNYGSSRLGGADSFINYTIGANLPVDSFRRYSRNSAGHKDRFSNYAGDANVVDQNFNTYGGGSTGGTGEFSNYHPDTNNPTGRFSSYSDNSNGRTQSFTSYATNANSGIGQVFTSYGKNGNGAPNEFKGYNTGGNVIGSGFTGYGEAANGANDTFTSYGGDANLPTNNFKSYSDGGNAAINSFSSYRDQSNRGDDTFQSYAKNSNSAKVDFQNYGKSFNLGTDQFSSYGKGAEEHQIGFKIYGVNPTFKDYNKKGVVFSRYTNSTLSDNKIVSPINNKWVEPGKFFRESMLKEGLKMPMPDIKDKMPNRSFLPRKIISRLPFSSSKIDEIKSIFHAGDNSSMESILVNAIKECERAPAAGETKRCVSSAEDMIDFATSVLGRNTVVRTTQNVNGSASQILIGKVKGINGGKVTKSVSCHQSLYPYLLYYCHSVPKVRVYEAEILDPASKIQINHGIAICHLDTSGWSSDHGAFSALGSGPGLIEVCHWIFENDMTWAVAD